MATTKVDVNLIDASGTPGSTTALFGNGTWAVPSGGKIGQVVIASNVTEFSISTVIPQDSTIPQNTEGVEVETVAITPANSSSTLIIFAHAHYTAGSSSYPLGALFVDTTANAIAATIQGTGGSSIYDSLTILHTLSAASTSARTYKFRVGPNTGNGYVGRDGGGNDLGNIASVTMIAMEVLP